MLCGSCVAHKISDNDSDGGLDGKSIKLCIAPSHKTNSRFACGHVQSDMRAPLVHGDRPRPSRSCGGRAGRSPRPPRCRFVPGGGFLWPLQEDPSGVVHGSRPRQPPAPGSEGQRQCPRTNETATSTRKAQLQLKGYLDDVVASASVSKRRRSAG